MSCNISYYFIYMHVRVCPLEAEVLFQLGGRD